MLEGESVGRDITIDARNQMLKIKTVGRLFLDLQTRRKQMLKAKLQNRRLAFKVVAAKVGRHLALGIERWRWVSVGTAPAGRVVRGVGPVVPRNRGWSPWVVSQNRKRG